MSIIQPIGSAGLGTVVLRPLPDVQPFSIQSGYSFEGILSDMRTWLRDVLVPYLEDTSAQAIFQQNVDTMIDTVNSALTEQSGIVTAALNAAVNEVINGAIPVEDALVLAVLNSVSSSTKQWLNNYTFYAPAPNGVDDRPVLQPLLDAMMHAAGIGSGPGVVLLRPGVYKGNFTMNAGFWSGKVKGAGKQATYVQSLDATKAVFNVKGSSGSITSGSIEDLTIAGTDYSDSSKRLGIGIELDSIGGFHVERVQFTNLAKGHRWIISAQGGFTEFDVLRDINMNYVDLPLEYAGAGSYHGSGVDGNSIIGLLSGAELMEVGAGCNVYNAPLSLTIFTTVGSGPGNVIVNRYGGPIYFYGHLRMEMQGGEYTMGWAGGAYVYYSGTINMWGGPMHLGLFFLVDKVQSTGTSVLPYLKPWNHSQTLDGNVQPVMGGAPINGPGTYESMIDVLGPNGYWYSATVRSWTSGTSVPATVDVVREHFFNDPAGVGKPTFSWDNGLKLLNANFNNQYKATCNHSCKVHAHPQDNLGQY